MGSDQSSEGVEEPAVVVVTVTVMVIGTTAMVIGVRSRMLVRCCHGTSVVPPWSECTLQIGRICVLDATSGGVSSSA
jgi:hypothetical protein